jgi:hypothetical protein
MHSYPRYPDEPNGPSHRKPRLASSHRGYFAGVALRYSSRAPFSLYRAILRGLTRQVSKPKRRRNAVNIAVALALLLSIAILSSISSALSSPARSISTKGPMSPDTVIWNTGDLFLGVGAGQYQVRAPDGTWKETLDDGRGGLTSGCAFDTAGNLYATNIDRYYVDKYQGVDPHDRTDFGGGYNGPEMVVFDASGKVYVSNVNYEGIRQFDANGNYIRTILPGTRVDYFDIAADQDTILYTQEGTTIEGVSISTGQTFTFASGATHAYALRIIPLTNPQFSGDVLLADLTEVKLYDTNGGVIRHYDITSPDENTWHALNLDPDGVSFWSGDSLTSNYYEFNIDTTARERGPYNTGTGQYTFWGMCVKGEQTAGQPTSTPIPTATPTSTSTSTPTPTVAPTVTCSATSQWCTDLSPNVGTGANELRGVVATRNDDVWAVGGYDITDQGGQPLVEHWNGGVWTTPTPSSIPTVGILNGVAAFTNSDVWAVSDSAVIHWNGTSWVTSPAPNGARAVSVYTTGTPTPPSTMTPTPTPYDVWAVGATNIEHFDGTSWSVSTPVPNGDVLNGVVAINHNNMWAVGNAGSNPLVIHYTGSWTTVAIPTPTSAVSVNLNSVDAYNVKSVWIAGTYYANGHDNTLTEYWDGSSWRIVSSPNPSPGDNDLYKVFVTNPGDVWAVGAYAEGSSGSQGSPGNIHAGQQSLLLHWNGQGWDHIDSPSYGVGSQALAATGATSLSISGQLVSSDWAVGSYLSSGTSPSQTFIEHITPPAYPPRTTSYYENEIDLNGHHAQGCRAAQSHDNGIIVLDYGQPKCLNCAPGATVTPQYGTVLIGSLADAYISTTSLQQNDITHDAEQFAKGYDDAFYSTVSPTPVDCPHVSGTPGIITISVSINNYLRDSILPPDEISAHAQAWATMITNVKTFADKLHGEVRVAAGIDAEPDFDPGPYAQGTPSRTEMWLNTYAVATVAPYYDFGSLDGYPCRPTGYPGTIPDPLPCRDQTWTVDRDWQVSWGIPQAIPLPEIYKPLFAREWYIVKRWGIERYPSYPIMPFRGVMTQCDGPGCLPGNLDSTMAWPIHWLELNSDPVTNIDLGPSTHIVCSNGYTHKDCTQP